LFVDTLDDFELDYYRPLGNPTKFIHELIRHFSRLKDEDIQAADYLRLYEDLRAGQDKAPDSTAGQVEDGADMEINRIGELAKAYHLYNKLLLDNGYLDFGDLIFYTIKLFRERPNILESYRQKFKYIMVDEFQDTNWSQYELIKMLAAPSNNLVVVGDDDQSIYRFRGASMSNIMQFKDDYPQAKEVVLINNYRSGQAILDTAYRFITHNNPNRLEVRLGIDKRLVSGKPGGDGQVRHWHYATEAEETAGVAEEIIRLHHEEGVPLAEIAVLVRANDTADKFTAELTRRQIPNQFMSSKGLYYKPVILDCLAYLRLLDNYHESSALFRVLNMEAFKVSHADIIELTKFAQRKTWSLFEALGHCQAIPGLSPETVTHVQRLLALVARQSVDAQKEKASKLFVDFINDSGIIKPLDHDKDKEVFACLDRFYRKIKDFEANFFGARLKDFMEAMAMEMDAGETGSLAVDLDDVEVVKIMTVHASKGLEFSHVFLANLVDKKFPTIARGEKISIPNALLQDKLPIGESHIEEERRLFYVAVTRAKQVLYYTTAADYGGAREKKPSKFIAESGVDAVEDRRPKSVAGSDLLRDLDHAKQLPVSGSAVYPLPARFSFSQVEAFSKCPLQYKFGFILKIPVADKPSMTFGRVMHSTLRDFTLPFLGEGTIQPGLFGSLLDTKAKAPDMAEFNRILDSHWIDDGYPSKASRDSYRLKARNIIKIFREKGEERGWPAIMYLEKSFAVKIGGHIFKGAIDRIDRMPDGTVRIVDYKTGNPKEKLLFDDKRQLLLYQVAVEEVFGHKVSELAYYYLENGVELSFVAKDKDIDKVKETLAAAADEIRQCRFVPKPSPLCQYCDFNRICEFRD
jgi:DNA helicase II / ATP-dependent DNA helicase PcrA